MANDIDKTSPHYKGDFGSIYEVNKKFPTGGVAGDFVVIEGWAHYWNADRATWCVNAERDSYWDEVITNIIEKFKLVRGATYMGVASLDTAPAKIIGAKMYYFATVSGTYKNFGDLVVPQGINVLYSENGSSWVNTTLLEVAQELGVSTKKVVSQKAVSDALNLKANQSSVNEVLAKKFDKESVVQESGEAEDKVMSQKAVSDKLSDLEFKKKYYNLYNFAYQSGLLVNDKVVEDVNWVTSDYIPFGANKTFEVKLYGGSYGHNIEFFDIDFNIIGTVNDGNNSVYTKEVISPVNTAYIRISVVNDAYRKRQNITEQYIGNSELLNYVEDCSMKSSLNIHYKSVELNNEIYRICLYGDSISSTDYKWYKELMQGSTGIDDVYNAGFSGARTAQLAKDAQLQRVLDYSANLVIIEVGGNDVGDVVGTFGMNRTQPVVEQTDISHDYEGTYFIQAVDHIIRKILSQYTAFVPYIAVMTPTPQKRKGGENTWNLHRNWQNKRDAVVECCLKNNIHCIDMFNLWGVDMSKEPSWTSPTNTTESKGIYTMDGLHPNKDGYNRMVQVITSQIKVSGSLKNFGNKLFTSNLDPTGKTTDTKHRTCYLRKVNPHLEKILYKVGVYDVNTSLCIFDKNRNIIDSYTRKGDKIDNSHVFYFDKDAAYYSVMTLAPNLGKSILVEFYKNASSKNILWLGTSIPAGKVNGISYPDIVGEQVGVGVINNAVGASFISTGCYNFNNPMSNLSSKDLSPGECLTETVAEKEERFRPKVDDGTISEDDLNTIKSFSYENLVLPYLDRVDTVVIDHGYNDRLVIANQLKKKGLDELDWQSRDRETYIGALNYLVDSIKEKYPRMNIIISGHYRADTDECRYLCAIQSEIGLHFGFPVLKLWEYAAMSSEVFVKGTSNYLEEFNNTYKTSYTARKKDSDGNITELQICCPDFTHPHSDLSGTTINKIGLILSKLIGGLIND